MASKQGGKLELLVVVYFVDDFILNIEFDRLLLQESQLHAKTQALDDNESSRVCLQHCVARFRHRHKVVCCGVSVAPRNLDPVDGVGLVPEVVSHDPFVLAVALGQSDHTPEPGAGIVVLVVPQSFVLVDVAAPPRPIHVVVDDHHHFGLGQSVDNSVEALEKCLVVELGVGCDAIPGNDGILHHSLSAVGEADTVETQACDSLCEPLQGLLVQPPHDVALLVSPVPVDARPLHPAAESIHDVAPAGREREAGLRRNEPRGPLEGGVVRADWGRIEIERVSGFCLGRAPWRIWIIGSRSV
mmetsp:Transcript_11050/g.24332  ORF Transcript_11050/g.24332 Transcript_11050/m.24332 type:complete len:300 (+) Transcript_11050:1279-2178(+)